MKNQTYVIYCAQGRRKDECPFLQQTDMHCVECNMARYILRQPQTKESDTSENNAEQENNGQ
jgi:hypothetical protein